MLLLAVGQTTTETNGKEKEIPKTDQLLSALTDLVKRSPGFSEIERRSVLLNMQYAVSFGGKLSHALDSRDKLLRTASLTEIQLIESLSFDLCVDNHFQDDATKNSVRDLHTFTSGMRLALEGTLERISVR